MPTFGICLGAELLALGCGGEVRRGLAGPELGVLGVDLDPAAADDPVFGALRGRSRVVQWHWEEIASLPEGAVRLASSPAYPHQAFRVGEAAWGVQGHPEVTGDIAAAWAREDSPLLRAEGRTPGGPGGRGTGRRDRAGRHLATAGRGVRRRRARLRGCRENAGAR